VTESNQPRNGDFCRISFDENPVFLTSFTFFEIRHPFSRMKSFLRGLLVLPLSSALMAADFHVSPDGSDSEDGSRFHPFATIQRAQKAVRDFRATKKDHQEEIHVILHGGTYRLTAPLTFTPEDSGSEGAPVTYEAAPKDQGRVVVSGGKVITGKWTPSPGKPYWQISIPEAAEGKWVFNSLAVNGESRVRARYPNEGDKELRAEGPEPGGDAKQSLVYHAGDFDPSWTNPEDIDLVLMGFWTPVVHRVREVDPAKRVLHFKSSNSRTVDQFERLPRYYLSNVFEKLDSPGEWYLNKKTGVLYYYPLPGENLSKAEVVAPLLNSPIVKITGKLAHDEPVQYLRFQGIHFQDAGTDMNHYDGVYRQGHMFLGAAVSATSFHNGLFRECLFEQLGEYAIELADGCRDVTVEKCLFRDLGAGAIQIGVTDLGTLKRQAGPVAPGKDEIEPRREVSGIVVDNNIVHKIGTIWNGCYGIVIRFASNTKVTHNEVFDTHWNAIGLDARWTPTNGIVYAGGNEVAYNHLHHLGLRTQTDTGGIYQFAPLNTHIHHNLIHDTLAYPYNTGFCAVYLDETSTGALVENNIGYNLDGFSYLQNYGDGNAFRNNIGAFARDGFFHLGSLHDDLNYVEVTRNIYVTTNDVALSENFPKGKKPSLVSSNFYQTLETGKPLLFAGKTLTNWQAQGWDIGSKEGNAGFTDPLKGNFTLKPDSPAVTGIGFVPFDREIAKAGVYGDPAWTNYPKSRPMRKPYAVCSLQDLATMDNCSIDPNLYKPGTKFPVFSTSEQANMKDDMVVTEEVAGINGPRCIKVTDRAAYAATFYPCANMPLYGLDKGRLEFEFALMQPTNSVTNLESNSITSSATNSVTNSTSNSATNSITSSAATCSVELRSGMTAYRVGPAIKITNEGKVLAACKEIARVKPGQWTRFRMSLGLGNQSNGSYDLTISNPDGETKLTLPFIHKDFKTASSIVLTSPDKTDGTYYLDAISIKTVDPK
jgi:uncharacterized protein YejL (UPF0352 family)